MSYKDTNKTPFKKITVPIPINSSKLPLLPITDDLSGSDEESGTSNSPKNSPIFTKKLVLTKIPIRSNSSQSPSISPKSDNSSGSDEEMIESPRKSQQLPISQKISKPKFPCPELPACIVKYIFEYVLFQDLNYKGYDDLLMFYNNKEKNEQLFIYVLLCLKKITGQGNLAKMSFDPLMYADPEKLFQMFSKSKEIQQYFSNALSQLNQIEDLLDKGLVENLAKELLVFKNENYIASIAYTVKTNKITSLINKDNIKEIINLLRLPEFDAKKIREMQFEINRIITPGTSFLNKKGQGIPRASSVGLITLVIGIGIVIGGIYLLAKGDHQNKSYLEGLAIILSAIGIFCILGGLAGLGHGVNVACCQGKNGLDRTVRDSSLFLKNLLEQYNKFYKKNVFSEIRNIERFSGKLNENLITINDIFVKDLDRKHNAFINNYRRCGMFRELSKNKNTDVFIELDKNPRPNLKKNSHEKSPLLLMN